MRTGFYRLLALFLLLSTQNMFGDQISRTAKGLLEVERFQFGIIHWGPDGKTTSQHVTPETISFLGEGGEKTAEGIRNDGVFRISDNTSYRYSETLDRKSETEVNLDFLLESTGTIPTSDISWTVKLPNSFYEKNPVQFDGEVIQPSPDWLPHPGRKDGTLVLNLEKGILEITGAFPVVVRKTGDLVGIHLLFHKTPFNATFSAKLKYRPRSGTPQAGKLMMKPDSSWLPLEFQFGVLADSAVDFSGFLDAPAGKYGFLRINENGKFEFEKRPGKSVRFWGANLCSVTNFMSEQQTTAMLDDLAAMGSNTIRLHHFDRALTKGFESTGGINPEYMQKLDFLVAEARKRGIYTTLDLYTSRVPQEVKQFGPLERNEYKLLCYFDDNAYRSLLNYGKAIFGHRNQYSGVLWKDDPSIITLNFINEGTLPVMVFRMSPRVRSIVDAAWKKYAAEQKIENTPENKEKYYAQFLADSGKAFFKRLKRDLNIFGVRIPFSDQNFAETAGDTRTVFDYVDTHFYWGHPRYIGKERWKLPTYTEPASAITTNAGGIKYAFFTRVMDKPMTVTEWNYCYPNQFNSEGPILTAAYAALQDYSGLWQFAYSHTGRIPEPQYLPAFDYVNNPIMKLASRAGMLLFLRGDVQSAPTEIPILRAEEKWLAVPQLGLVVKTGSAYDASRLKSAKALIVPAQVKTDVKAPCPAINGVTEEQVLHNLADQGFLPAGSIDFETGNFVSETGELKLNRKGGTFSAVTPRSEAFILPEKESGNGNFMKVKNLLSFGVFFAASLDGMELKKSKRILIGHLTDVKSEGAVFRDSSMAVLEDMGTNKYLIRRGKAEITLKYSAPVRLFACAANGRRLFEIPSVRNGDTIGFVADTASAEGAVPIYELIAK